MNKFHNFINKVEDEEAELYIEDATKYYRTWLKLPFILFWFIFSLYFIWGIVDPSIFRFVLDGDSVYYGILMQPTGFTCWLIWTIIGFIVAGVTYYFVKLNIAKEVLKVEYLKKISEK